MLYGKIESMIRPFLRSSTIIVGVGSQGTTPAMPFGNAICSPGGMFLRTTSFPETRPFICIAIWK